MPSRSFSALIGKTLTSIENIDFERLVFHADDGTNFALYHPQDCCEVVRLEDIVGDLSDLIGSPVLQAEEVSSENEPAPPNADSYTWTFYKIATIKGGVTLRWLGESNGYYGEEVDFVELSSTKSPKPAATP